MKRKPDTHAGSVINDSVIRILYQDQNHGIEGQAETWICNHVKRKWEEFAEKMHRNEITKDELTTKLAAMDSWLQGKISGGSLSDLLVEAELKYPHFIYLMPDTLAKRYEEIRIARIWSMLLNPESLIQLRASIEIESQLLKGGGL